jgi:hypothetical protein
MAPLNIPALAGYSAPLDALTDNQRAAISEVVFCCRAGVLSVTAVFDNIDTAREVAGHIPAEVAAIETRRYGVDLESIANGRPRFYTDGDEPGTIILGFTYSEPGVIAEWKRYRRDPGSRYRTLIDRCSATAGAVGPVEVERAGGPELWTGPPELPEIAAAAGFHIIYLAKEAKDQSYLRLQAA